MSQQKKKNRPIFAEMGKKTSHFVYEIWLDNTTQNTRKWRVKKRSLTKKQKEMIKWVVVSNIFYLQYTPKLGEDEPILTRYFSKGLVQPPTSDFYLTGMPSLGFTQEIQFF